MRAASPEHGQAPVCRSNALRLAEATLLSVSLRNTRIRARESSHLCARFDTRQRWVTRDGQPGTGQRGRSLRISAGQGCIVALVLRFLISDGFLLRWHQATFGSPHAGDSCTYRSSNNGRGMASSREALSLAALLGLTGCAQKREPETEFISSAELQELDRMFRVLVLRLLQSPPVAVDQLSLRSHDRSPARVTLDCTTTAEGHLAV